MEQLPVSERLPRLYRAVLDAVAELESVGRRQEAAEVRSEATAAYSRAWNLAAERRLTALRIRADRVIDAARPRRGSASEVRPARDADAVHAADLRRGRA